MVLIDKHFSGNSKSFRSCSTGLNFFWVKKLEMSADAQNTSKNLSLEYLTTSFWWVLQSSYFYSRIRIDESRFCIIVFSFWLGWLSFDLGAWSDFGNSLTRSKTIIWKYILEKNCPLQRHYTPYIMNVATSKYLDSSPLTTAAWESKLIEVTTPELSVNGARGKMATAITLSANSWCRSMDSIASWLKYKFRIG